MGDHRAEIHITFNFHGKKYKCDLDWINYCPTEVDGVDQRVVEFFRESFENGIRRFEKQVYESHQEQRERETERQERAELERLQTKYGESKP